MQVDDALLYAERSDPRDGYPVLYLPGGFGHIAEFNGVTPALTDSMQLIGIDTRGHGRSTMGTRGLSYAQLESDVLAVVEHLKLKKLSIIGYSDGGIVALRLAANRQLEIEKVVVIGAHWQLGADDPVREDFKQITPAGWREEFPETYEQYMALNPEPDFDRFAMQVVNMWLADVSANGYPGELVRQITCDLLIAYGEDDPYLTYESMQALAERVPNSRLLRVSDAGHAVHDDQHEIFVEHLLAFFDDMI